MKLHIEDLPESVQKKVKKQTGTRTRISGDVLKRHALAVTALLMDDRELNSTTARRVLHKALKLLK